MELLFIVPTFARLLFMVSGVEEYPAVAINGLVKMFVIFGVRQTMFG
jgi:hypothetical protein